MAVRPRRVPARGRTRRVERRLLDEEDERPVRVAPGGDVCLPARDLLERPPEMHRRGPPRPVSLPRNGTAQGPVDLERTRSVAVSLETTPIGGAQPIAGDRDQLTGRHIEQDGPGRRELPD